MQVWADYGYWLEVKKARARNFKPIHMRGVTLVDIPEIEAFDAPDALVETYERSMKAFHPYGNRYGAPAAIKPRVKTVERPGGMTVGPGSVPDKEKVTLTRPGHAGKLWRPLMSDDFKTPMRVEHLTAYGGQYAKSHPFLMRPRKSLDSNPYDRVGEYHEIDRLPTRDQIVDINVRETGKDGEPAAILRVHKAAANLLVHQGTLWAVQKEPVYLVGMEDGKVQFELERPSSFTKTSGVAFPVTARDEAREFAHALAERHKVRKPSDPYKDVVADPAFLGQDMRTVMVSLAAQAMFRRVLGIGLRFEQAQNPIVVTLMGEERYRTPYLTAKAIQDMGDPIAFGRDLEQVVFDGRGWANDRKLADILEPLELARELGHFPEPDAEWDQDLAALADFATDESSTPSP